MNKKYIFFDIDGTLTSHTIRNHISDSTFLAIKKLRENGHFISLATGRAVFLTKEIAEKTTIESLVCEGGNGLIVDGELVAYEPINIDLAKDILRQCDELGIGWAVSNVDNPLLITRSEDVKTSFSVTSFIRKIEVHKDYDYNNETSIRRILIENNQEKYKQLQNIEKIGFMKYEGSPFALIEPDNKYKGIRKLLEILQGNEEDVIVFGDGINDISMFKEAKTSVAMGNAIDELKAIATYVTDDANSDGIYNACLHLGLID
ncbi:HAD family hydrolase [Anaerorhabdus sp.]|uniref:HAD family hydrolase n=1 Tax=Anaerorhabdus sp. TaxID=1872524 RepID=UPI002FC8EEA3